MTALPVEKTKALIVHSLVYFSLSIFLTLLSASNPWIGRLGYSFLAEIFFPIHKVANEASHFLINIKDNYINLIHVKSENDNLKQELQNLKTELLNLQEVKSRNRRLRSILEFKKSHKISGLTASVIAREPSQWQQALTIDKGSKSGVAINDAVVNQSGAVGQIVAVSAHTAKVQLINDLQSGVDVYIQSSRSRAVVKGYGLGRPELLFLNRENSVQKGDIVLTSGLDGIFPKGIPVAQVYEVLPASPSSLFHKVYLSTSVNFEKLEEVLVINKQKQ